MSIASNLTALDAAKDAIASAITDKGVTVGSGDGFADFASLIASISGGESLPAWIEEIETQTFSPVADTNADQNFALTMTSAPDVILVLSDTITPSLSRDYFGCITAALFGLAWNGASYYAMNSTTLAVVPLASASAVTNENITIATYSYGGTKCYWRASHTYTIVAIKVAL